MALLIGSGLAIADRLPPRWSALLGGHERLNLLHQWLGVLLAAVLVGVALLAWRRTVGLLVELLRYRRSDLGWSTAFLRHALNPGSRPLPMHDGRLDPLQRAVMAVLLLTAATAASGGVLLFILPGMPRGALLLVLRTHVYAAWGMMAVLALHVAAGLGLLPTHRGIAGSMFGDGSVPRDTAMRLWPGWTRRRP